jgi:hypothetical protein
VIVLLLSAAFAASALLGRGGALRRRLGGA